MLKIPPHRRTLPSGYAWQNYAVKAIRFISKENVDKNWNGEFSQVKSAYLNWVTGITNYIQYKSENLGLYLVQILAQLIEEPNEHKNIEILLWEQRKAVYVWAAWAYLDGPVPAQDKTETVLPLQNFWPKGTIPKGVVAEIFDATLLSQMAKQGNSKIKTRIVMP